MAGKHLDATAQALVGQVVLTARANDVPWKTLEAQFDISRRQLYRYALDVSSGGPRSGSNDNQDQMSQLSPEMSQQAHCAGIDG